MKRILIVLLLLGGCSSSVPTTVNKDGYFQLIKPINFIHANKRVGKVFVSGYMVNDSTFISEKNLQSYLIEHGYIVQVED